MITSVNSNTNWKSHILFYCFILFILFLIFLSRIFALRSRRGARHPIFLSSSIRPFSQREGWTPPKKRDCCTHLHDRRVNRGNEICGVATSVYKTTAVGMSTKHRALIWPRVYAGTHEGWVWIRDDEWVPFLSDKGAKNWASLSPAKLAIFRCRTHRMIEVSGDTR